MSEEKVPRGTGAASVPDLTSSTPDSNEPAASYEIKAVPLQGLRRQWFDLVLQLTGRKSLMKRSRRDRDVLNQHHVEALVEHKARNDAEREAIEASQREQDLRDYLYALQEGIRSTIQQQTLTATVTQVKGGVAKTTTSSNSSSVLCEVGRRTVTQIDSNPMWGTSFRLLGIPRERTRTVREVRNMLKDGQLQTHDEFVGKLGSNRHGVALIASDAVTQRDDHYDYETAKLVVSCAQRNSIFVINDTGNDIAGDAMQATLELSDVMVVPTILTGDSMEGARVTLDSYREWGHRELVRHSIVVVSGLEPGDNAENYRQQLGLGPDHILIGIPWEDRLKMNEVIDLNKNDLYTLIAMHELVFVMVTVARHVRNNGSGGAPLKFEQGRLVPISSGRTPVLPYVHSYDKE